MQEMPCFVELPIFEQYREDYLNDDEYRNLQNLLAENPEAGSKIKGTGGIRKVRYADKNRGKGTRGGLRVIYYYQISANTFLLLTVYNKDEMSDLSEKEKKILKKVLAEELQNRCSK